MSKLRTNPDSEHHIRRIDTGSKKSGNTRGFQVHFSREGRLWTKFFSDVKSGGKEKARRAARKFRDALEHSLPAAQARVPMRDSATGYSLRTRKNRNGSTTQYISASVAMVDGRPVRKAFRVGNDIASVVKAALDWRVAMVSRRLRAEKRRPSGVRKLRR